MEEIMSNDLCDASSGALPMEIERKFLIEYPDIAWLVRQPGCRRADIVQTYLRADDGEETRIRRRSVDGREAYFKTTKRAVTGMKRVEIEHSIGKEEYLRLLLDADPAMHPIQKARYCLSWDGKCYEIDVYPFWKDRAIMEVELRDEHEDICFPSGIKIIREVTDDPRYKNAALAKMESYESL